MVVPTSFADRRLVKSATTSLFLILALALVAAGAVWINIYSPASRILGIQTQTASPSATPGQP